MGSRPTDKSPFGLLDMTGNVKEWTSSAWSTDYSKVPKDPIRVYRGGTWRHGDASRVRCAHRDGARPAKRDVDLGLRCARSN